MIYWLLTALQTLTVRISVSLLLEGGVGLNHHNALKKVHFKLSFLIWAKWLVASALLALKQAADGNKSLKEIFTFSPESMNCMAFASDPDELGSREIPTDD